MKFFTSLKTSFPDKKECELISKEQIEGVILFPRNILELNDIKKLTNELKCINPNLEIAIDEEGGAVSRLRHISKAYSQPYVASLTNKQAKDYYLERSALLKDLGITLNLAPLIDIADKKSVMYKRAYSHDVNRIIDLASICIIAQKEVGIKSCIKHFPGEGFTTADSHSVLPIIDVSYSKWISSQGKVYNLLIKTIPDIEYVMVGHVVYNKISQDITSLSKYWVVDELKTNFKFKGKIITDDICMKALNGISQIDLQKHLTEAKIDTVIVSDPDNPLLQLST